MPYKDLATKKLKDFQRINRRRTKWFSENGPCVNCRGWENLQLDHINPAEKVSHRIWGWSDKKRIPELAKCQALCYECHKVKTKVDFNWGGHGSSSMYKREGCRCDVCVDAMRKYNRELRRKLRNTPPDRYRV